ncbi:undecaprenyldiphospho-muramoylpentapeptide beta-N-acetylglucosaminyltransferase [Anaerorhabdus furcosa]|uniref:UDP-N-acetylglucosamine--N-acetylmuramyl-(pentapeptide) pyrophosphoryl-undecaprenol N-acetylglucosamine transferase n=1 Tax=Anaerorhabdus furcosa TaxID=118967 RepID=A0A1T4Q5P1_9FIRM|nr:undecaprenyldiphospho-muramoylpentapeptide beta-N-acetylglucosaminyltransferase [Anaerorhabdus furcosa]SJZ98548.1 UDP-N-acetylglucosamine-N-acetylmuramylpentapeptide N-acetylglucosamine transferase [Anaerorhabdus furcosa]
MRIVIATGGTGGHIYPALSLAKAIKEEDPSAEFLFIGSTNRMEATEIPNAGYKYQGIDVIGMNGSILSKIKAFYLLKKAEKKCKTILETAKPDIVIGFGNYISVPVCWAAKSLGIPVMLHEQNSYAGKANKMLAKSADAVVGCYEENLSQFPSQKTRILGNPRASEAAKMIQDKTILKKYGLVDNLPLVVIVMGSLGSESVNKVLKQASKRMDGKNYQALVVTGKKGYDEFIESCKSTGHVHIVPYIEGIEVMCLASLVVVRGGATTSAEITALGLPSIIIPSPYVPNNHQVMNALALQNKNAAIMIEEKDLTAENLVEKIDEILSNEALQKEMSLHAKELGKPNASHDMMEWIKDLVGDRNE